MSDFTAKYTNCDFRWGFAPDRAGELTAISHLDLRGPTSKGKERGVYGGNRKGKEWRER